MKRGCAYDAKYRQNTDTLPHDDGDIVKCKNVIYGVFTYISALNSVLFIALSVAIIVIISYSSFTT